MVELLVFGLFGGALFFWIAPGVLRVWMKHEAIRTFGAEAPPEGVGYDRRDWAVVVGLVAWLIGFPLVLWMMDTNRL